MKQRILLSMALVGAIIGAVFFGAPPAFADRYTRADLDARLENGINTAINWDSNMGDDNSCRSVTNMARINGASIATLRNNYINTSYAGHSTASYRSSTWLSKFGFPNVTNPTPVAYGSTFIDLQINNVSFLCGTLVAPDVGTSCGGLSTASMFDDARWVYTTNPDQTPNPLGNSCLRPARTGTYTRIEGVTVTSTGAFGGTTNLTPGQTLAINRDNLSRYWFSNRIGFRYTFSAPVTSNGTIRLTLRVKRIQSYNTGDDRCQSGGNSITVASPSDFARCDTTTDSVALQIVVPSNYNLQPSVSTSTTSVNDRESFTVSGNVRNTGTTASTNTNWRITKMYLASGAAIPSTPAAGNGDACAAYSGYVAGSCQTLTQGNRGFAVGNTAVGTNTPDTADLSRGARVCYTTSVSTPTPAANPVWRYSALRCVLISKKPKLQVQGGDVRVRGKIETGIATFDGKQYGSWVEYGAFAVGTSTGFASGSGLNNGTANPGYQWNMLTFANRDNSGAASYGSFTLPPSTALSSQFMAAPSAGAPAGNLGSLASGTYDTTNLTISSSTIGQQAGRGKKIIIRATGTITITGDITYQGTAGDTFTSIDQIPQVIIIANRINIQGSATRIDAWLLTTGATGIINTCSDVPDGAALNLSICPNKLTVNGPIETARLLLRRTGGSGSTAATAGDPAEVFNLRGDAYIWGRTQAAQNGKAQTVYSKELPPRF